MTDSRAAEALLEGLVDYAGLFPPAALAMPEAVARYAEYARGAERRLLGRFVVAAARLPELAAATARLGAHGPAASDPWRLSVLAGASDATALAAFNAAQAGRIVIDTVEAKADAVSTITGLAAALGASYTVFVEIPIDPDPTSLIEAIGANGLRAKVRTGGVIADAFPAPADVLRFLVACVAGRVPFKATAGLHHAVRGEFPLTYAPDSVRGTMYGFLNVFLAAVLLHRGTGGAEVAQLLEERDAAAIVPEPDALRWRNFRVTAGEIAAARRELAGSFGSCSFEEPVHELTTLRFI